PRSQSLPAKAAIIAGIFNTATEGELNYWLKSSDKAFNFAEGKGAHRKNTWWTLEAQAFAILYQGVKKVSVVYGHHIRTKQFNESLFIKNDFKPKEAKAQQYQCQRQRRREVGQSPNAGYTCTQVALFCCISSLPCLTLPPLMTSTIQRLHPKDQLPSQSQWVLKTVTVHTDDIISLHVQEAQEAQERAVCKNRVRCQKFRDLKQRDMLERCNRIGGKRDGDT
ncbi:hypothetical protein PROFUN_02226, partial [Planoprotostelium fungivorum]